MKKFLFDCGTRETATSLSLLFLRVTVGLMMLIGHGLPKIKSFAEKKDGFPVPDFFPLSLMSPPVSMIATIGAEVVAAGLLALGLLTRPAAFVLAFTMVVAAFAIHAEHDLFGPPPSKELAVMFLLPCVALLLSGAGGYSIDAAIYKEKRRKGW